MALLEISELEALSPIFRGEAGNRRARRVLKLLDIDKFE